MFGTAGTQTCATRAGRALFAGAAYELERPVKTATDDKRVAAPAKASLWVRFILNSRVKMGKFRSYPDKES